MSKLKTFIAAQGEHHIASGKIFKAMAAYLVGSLPEAAGECAKLSAEHALAAEDCITCAKAMGGDDELEKTRLMPWPMTTVLPSDARVRPVPRHGQPNVPDFDAVNVPAEFKKLLQFDDEV